MRILIVHPRLSVKGGGERVAIHSIKEALREGHEVYLACEEFDVDDFEDFFGVQGLFKEVRILTYPPFRPLVRRFVLYQRLFYHQRQLRHILSKNPKFDIVLNTAEVANQPATKSHTIQYCYFPEYFSHLESNSVHRLWETYYFPAKVFYRSRVGHTEQLLAVSNFTRSFVRDLWHRDSTTLYPPCPVDLYEDLNGPKKDLVITVGRISPEKRMEIFLEIARRLPRLRFAIIGSVAQDQELYYRRLREHSPTNVSFTIAPLRKARDIMADAKIYVHSAKNEHFGITIVEAMAGGCVPVVNDSGGPREIVSTDVGCRWKTLEEAVSQISALTNDDARRRTLSEAAASSSKRFGPDAFESGLKKVLTRYESPESENR
jgi:alpha-1,2-mannosyltransferase